jgi:hypothetical protein
VILHRVAASLRNKDWSTALLEFLIVVVGIFVGLQVDDWNQQRKDRKDEAAFLASLHVDLVRADELTQRLRHRRLDRLDDTVSTGEVLFGGEGRLSLTEEECNVIVWSTAFNINAPGLPSVDELISTGRMGIIRDSELRTALVALRQTRVTLEDAIAEKSMSSNFVSLPRVFPELFNMTMYFDEEVGEVRTRNECDLGAMRANQAFLNQFSANADGYDAYIRDGLKPWSSQFDKVHALVDAALGIEHPVSESE